MSKKDELLNQIKELEEKNRLLQSENKMLQNTLNAFRPYDSFSQFKVKDDLFLPDTPFWTEPLKDYWGQFAKNPMSDFFHPKHGYGLPTDYPWLVAEEEPEDREKEEMRKKVKELEGLIESLRNELEGVSEPLALVADAIKKKAMFTNVAAAYHLLQQMNSIFMGYEPWYKNVRPLESFLMKEKERATSIPSDYNIIPTDEDLADAISSINGKGKVLDERQKWMGVCSLVMARFSYPRNLKACCEKLANLPYKEKLEIPCNYDNVRKLQVYGFARENYEQWPSYRPRQEEKKNFEYCYDVGRALEQKLEPE